MIKPNELRIGNAVICKNRKGEDFFTTVDNIGSWGIDGGSTYDGDIEGEECWPIPLTPEILEKCGFTLTISEHIYGNGRVCVFFFDGELNYDIAKVSYLHQLQNLYYCLCGEELNIKL